jgi:hypothetical protein
MGPSCASYSSSRPAAHQSTSDRAGCPSPICIISADDRDELISNFRRDVGRLIADRRRLRRLTFAGKAGRWR